VLLALWGLEGGVAGCRVRWSAVLLLFLGFVKHGIADQPICQWLIGRFGENSGAADMVVVVVHGSLIVQFLAFLLFFGTD
jgi:hypothetical protein